MRFVISVLVLAAAVLSAGAALADPFNPVEEKPWAYDLSFAREIVAEVEPNDACPGQVIHCEDIVNPAGISASTDVDWYEIELTAGIRVTIGTDASELCDPDLGDSYLELYGPDCTVARLAYDDDGGPGAYSLIANYAVATTGLYHIKVRGYSASYTGCYKLFVTCVIPPPPPVNDTCAGAILWDRCSGGTINGDLTYATNDYSPQPPSPGCTGYGAAAKDVVFMANLQAGDLLHLVYTTAAYDGSLYVVTDCSQPGATCVIGEDDPEPETINWTATASGLYFIIADGYSANAGGPFTLEWAITCPPPGGACCFADGSCLMLPETDCTAQGGIWYGPTAVCEPNPCPPPIFMGACCALDGSCQQTTEGGCPAPNVWFADLPCEPNPCPPPPVLGACCFTNGSCLMLLEADCLAQNGNWLGGNFVCEPNPCPPPPTGACCLLSGECVIMTADQCAASNGSYQGNEIPCVPNPCPPVPTDNTTWGRIKIQYR